MAETSPEPGAIALHVASRLHALEGEARLNLLRISAVALFYAVHLVNRYAVGMSAGLSVPSPIGPVLVYDTVATAVSVGWAGMVGGVLLALRTGVGVRFLPVGTTLADLGFLSILLLVGNGPTSPMLAVLPVLVSASALRGSRQSVWLTTVGALAVYGACVGAARLARPEHLPATYHVLVWAAALATAGVVADLVVGGSLATLRAFARNQARLLASPPAGSACPWCEARGSGAVCGTCGLPRDPSAVALGRPPSALQVGAVHLGWTASVLALVLLSACIAVGLALSWPALLVPFAGATVLLLLALARLLQLDLKVDEEDRAIGRTVSTLGTAAAGAALGASVIAMLLGVALLMMVGTAVIAVALCFAVVMGMGA